MLAAPMTTLVAGNSMARTPDLDMQRMYPCLTRLPAGPAPNTGWSSPSRSPALSTKEQPPPDNAFRRARQQMATLDGHRGADLSVRHPGPAPRPRGQDVSNMLFSESRSHCLA